MAIIEFKNAPEEDCIEISEMSRQELLEFMAELQEMLRDLDAREPKNRNSDAYEAWAEDHEDLEDAIDEVQERLEEM